MAGLSNRPDLVLKDIQRLNHGAVSEIDGVRFEWGNVTRLVEGRSLNAKNSSAQQVLKTLRFEPSYVCHIDHLSRTRKLELEREFKLPSGALTGPLSLTKVDLFISCQRGNPYFISIKSLTTPSKLGQVSARTNYGSAMLDGGLESVSIPATAIPEHFSWKDTDLTEKQFDRASRKNRQLAFFKANFRSDWSRMVNVGLAEAERQVRDFCSTLSADRDSLLAFLRTALAGSLSHSPNFFVVLDAEVIHLEPTLQKLEDPAWRVTYEDASTPKKFAMKIGLTRGRENYWLMRIEPSFDGDRAGVTHTKGIIYYFQQFPRKGVDAKHYKRLLLDIRD